MADENVAAPTEEPEDDNIEEGPVEASDGDVAMTEDELEEARDADDAAKAEAPPETSESDEDMIAQAVGISYANFKQRHNMTAKVLTARMGDPVEFLTETLVRDEDYKALIYATESDIEASRIAKVVVKVALTLAERIIIAL